MYLIKIKGIVQGVGFRPFVYKEAIKHNIKGYVLNTGSGVEILTNKKEFIEIFKNIPKLAKIDNIELIGVSSNYNENNYQDFKILKSENIQNNEETILPSDIYICKDCINELNDKNNKRYNYYFITCTNCGPRFSIIKDYPYDRPFTSMDKFKMCKDCKKEYTNPLDRRYHAQTIACKNCGPKLKLVINKKIINEKDDIEKIKKTTEILKKDEIIAIKGVGGFHLTGIMTNKSAIKIKKALNRFHKPFAIMVKDIEMAKKYVIISKKEEKILSSQIRPIVILKKKDNTKYKEISELDSLGVMMPYTALHYLLFKFINKPIIMTSANIPSEPIITQEKEIINQNITNNILTHEREIINRVDDSVIKVINDKPLILRRSRGFAPIPIKLPFKCEDTLALGAELNNTICIAKKDNAFLSGHIGTTSNLKTFEFFKKTIEIMLKITKTNPKIIACDLHPGYETTKYAKILAKKFNAKLIQIQHHKAHVASVAGEYNLKNYIGISCDGLGYGEDEKIWGGEIFDVNNSQFKRIGKLEDQFMIGGDLCTINPKKMLFSILTKIFDEKKLIKLKLFNEKESKLYIKQLKENFNIHQTSSTGRVIDAISAIFQLCDKTTYEARSAMLLESFGEDKIYFNKYKKYNYTNNNRSNNKIINNNTYNNQIIKPIIKNINGIDTLMTTPLIKHIFLNKTNDIFNNQKLANIALNYIANGLFEIANKYAIKNQNNYYFKNKLFDFFDKNKNINKRIVFSGGVAYNNQITNNLINKKVIINKNIPCGDGGISYGQCIIANSKNY
jgi:hydrogenase maturation protein HypF